MSKQVKAIVRARPIPESVVLEIDGEERMVDCSAKTTWLKPGAAVLVTVEPDGTIAGLSPAGRGR